MSSTTTTTTTTTMTGNSDPADHNAKRLLAAGLTLGLLGAIAVGIIIWWTYHLRIPTSPYNSDLESSSASSSSSPRKPTRRPTRKRGGSFGHAVALGGGLVRKATMTLLTSSSPSNSSRKYGEITPFDPNAPPTPLENDRPKFIHIPGKDMRIATRMTDGTWAFDEPPAPSNRRSVASGFFGSEVGHGGGGGGARGINVGSVEQVSPTQSSFYHHHYRASSRLSQLNLGLGPVEPPPVHSPFDRHPHPHPPTHTQDRTRTPTPTNPFELPPLHTSSPFDMGDPFASMPATPTSSSSASHYPPPQRSKNEKDKAKYGFSRAEEDREPPPPAYDRHREGIRRKESREW